MNDFHWHLYIGGLLISSNAYICDETCAIVPYRYGVWLVNAIKAMYKHTHR